MKFKNYLLRVLTPLHVGTGSGLGHIDLPTYREASTHFPAIPSSAIKGSLRSRRILEVSKSLSDEEERKLRELLKVKEGGRASLIDRAVSDFKEIEKEPVDEKLRELAMDFGTKDREGRLVFTDARILFFPVKSLRGIFALITCPYVLKRFREDTLSELMEVGDVRDQDCILATVDSKVKVEEEVVLEEFTLKVKGICQPKLKGKFDEGRVVVVSDNLFNYMVETHTEVQTHVKINVETGTVQKGALWTEEYVPSEAIFYFKVIGDGFKYMPRTLQIGGNSSTGKGLLEVVEL